MLVDAFLGAIRRFSEGVRRSVDRLCQFPQADRSGLLEIALLSESSYCLGVERFTGRHKPRSSDATDRKAVDR